jgi:diguanylate cyclase (GGDEF)-like protein
MFYLATFFYLVSFAFQAIASWMALISFGRVGKHRWGWLFFSFALLLMLGRRISPIIVMWRDSHVNMTDAFLSVPISFFLMLGVISIRKAYADLEDKAEQLACAQKRDFLTETISRAELFSLGEKEVERSLRTRRTFALLMLDLDHFKLVNDQLGHKVGDVVLKSLSCVCQNTLRKMDVFSRYGGEEFVALLPETTLENAREVAERLRKNVSDHLGFASGLHDRKITVSIGVAVFEPNGNTDKGAASLFSEVIEQADMAMYHAKNAGRDQVSVFEFAAA